MAWSTNCSSKGVHIDGETLDALLAYIALPSEFTAASGFAQARGIPLYLVDMDGHSRSHLGRMDELLATENLAKLLCGTAPEGRSFELAAARLFFEKGVSLFSYTEEMRARDSHMRDRIGELMESHQGWRAFSTSADGSISGTRMVSIHRSIQRRPSFMIKLFVFDLGNVILPFDNHQIAEKLHRRSALRDSCAPLDIFTYLFDWEKGSINGYEEGLCSSLEFFSDVKERYKLDLGFDEFKDIWNNIFSENPEVSEIITCLKAKGFPPLSAQQHE